MQSWALASLKSVEQASRLETPTEVNAVVFNVFFSRKPQALLLCLQLMKWAPLHFLENSPLLKFN